MTHPENYLGIIYQCDDTYSEKDCTGWDLSDRQDMSGIVIHGICLSNETPNALVLPPDLTGATFLCCNLDNVFIPDGNTLINCSNRLFQTQADGQVWEVEASLQTVGLPAGRPTLGGDTISSPAITYTPIKLFNPPIDGQNTDPTLIPLQENV